jgi:glutaryl-CoA dehydrogenase
MSSKQKTDLDSGSFVWEDPLLLNDELTEEERLIARSAHDYAQDRLMSRVLEANRKEIFHTEIMREMGDMGLLGITIPEAYGGAGLGYVAYHFISS